MRPPSVSRLHRLRLDAGMTLIEVMIAMTVMVIGLVMVFSAMNTAAATRDRARSHSLALQSIQQQIENLQADEWNSRFCEAPISFPVEGINVTPGIGRSTPGQITRMPDSSGTVHHLRFRVDWVDREGPGWIEIDFYNFNRAS